MLNLIINLIKSKKDFLFSIFYTILVIAICIAFSSSKFFFIDDSINEYIGFYKQYGKIWSEGHIPFIVDSMFVGGNSMIELQRGIFLPQSIIASLFAHFVSIKKTGILIAIMNIFLVTYSSIKIAKSFKIQEKYALTFSAFMAIQPTFLYQFSAGWWNAAYGQAWATVSIATLLVLRAKQTTFNILVHYISVICLLASGWPHGVIGYGIFALVILIFDFLQTKKINISLIIPNILSILIAIPIYSEFIYSSKLLTRPNGYHNNDDFFVPEWSSLFMSFYPNYYDFIHYFGGYILITIPLAFSTVYLVLVFFIRNKTLIFNQNKKNINFFFVLICVYFMVTQLPTQFGPLRYPARFVPFVSFSLCLFTFYILSKAKIHISKSYYFLVMGCFIISTSSSFNFDNELWKYVFLNLCSFIFLLIIPFIINKNKYIIVSTAIISLILMLSGNKTLGGKYVAFNPLPNSIEPILLSDGNLSGFMISFTAHDPKKSINDLSSSQFGAYNIKTINGYSPNGNINFEQIVPYPTPHAIFKTEEALTRILTVNTVNSCIANQMGISVINLARPDFEHFKDQLAHCGYTDVQTTSYDDVNASLPLDMTKNWKLTPLTVVPNTINYQVKEHSNNYDIVQLNKRDTETIIIFPRVWWHGYTAKFNNQELPVLQDETGVLVTVKVPAGNEGILELSYFPKTWRKVWWLPLLSIFGLFAFIIASRKLEKKKEDLCLKPY